MFIYTNSKFKVTYKIADFECRYIKTEKNPSKISNIIFAILPFSHKNTLTKLPSWVLWSLLLAMKPSDVFKNGQVHSTTKNAKSGVRQSQVCYLYAQAVPLPLNNCKNKNKMEWKKKWKTKNK